MFRQKKQPPFVCAVIVAAGRASRMEGIDKQLAEIGGVPVIIRSILAFEQARLADEIIVVTRRESIPEFARLVREYGVEKVTQVVAGGKTRQESVARGVDCANELSAYFAIHDGARPLVHPGAIDACIQDAVQHRAAMLGVKVKDTIKQADEQRNIVKTISRDNLYLAQTPQVFEAGLYRKAMQAAMQAGADYTDDCQLVEAIGQSVYISRGHYSNIKITTPDDIFYAQALLEQMED